MPLELERTFMSPRPLDLLVITASTRTDRFGPVPARWFASRASGNERFSTQVLDLAAVDLPQQLPASIEALGTPEGREPEMQALYRQLDAAEAFVVVTPEYNHGYPAPLKLLIDWHFSVWRCKPVAFVSYGGLSGGLRAVEQLRQVFAEMHATTLRDGVSFDCFWERFNESGEPVTSEANGAADIMLERLSWWALTLRMGRTQLPYR